MAPAQDNKASNTELQFAEPAAVFVYGTLMAEELLSKLLSGSADPIYQPESLTRKPAVLHGYRRVPVKHVEYPAIIPATSSDKVDGYLINPICLGGVQWQLLDEFEGDQYSRDTVRVALPEAGEVVLAQAYVWKDSPLDLKRDEEWDYSYFRKMQLGLWVGAV